MNIYDMDDFGDGPSELKVDEQPVAEEVTEQATPNSIVYEDLQA